MMYEHTPVTTTDATPTIIAQVEIPEFFAGVVTVDVIGLVEVGTPLISGLFRVRFVKGTTLALDTPVDLDPLNDGGIGAAVAVINDGENIAVQATGVAATNIHWIVRTDVLMTNATVLP